MKAAALPICIIAAVVAGTIWLLSPVRRRGKARSEPVPEARVDSAAPGGSAPYRARQSTSAAAVEEKTRRFVLDHDYANDGNGGLALTAEETTQLNLDPLNEAELAALAADPEKDPHRLAGLICLAGARRHDQVQSLLSREDLRGHPQVRLALIACDYSVNGNRKALDYLLAKHALEGDGDSDTLAVLSYIDEWERSIPVIQEAFTSGDGAAGEAMYIFWLRRMSLFPDSHRRYRERLGPPGSGR